MRLSRIEDAIEWLLWEAVKFTGHSPAGGIVTQGMINDIYEQINILKDEVNLLKNESSIPKYKIEYLETMPYPDLLKIAFDLNLTNEKIARTEIIMRMMESDRIIVIVPEDFEEE